MPLGADNINVLDTFFNLSQLVVDLLGKQTINEMWQDSTVLPNYSVGLLLSHITSSFLRVETVSESKAPDNFIEVSYEYYYGNDVLRDPDGYEDGISIVMLKESQLKVESGPDQIRRSLELSSDRLRSKLNKDVLDEFIAVVSVKNGAAKLADFMRTRITDIVVHLDDLFVTSKDLGTFDQIDDRAVDIALYVCQSIVLAHYGKTDLLRSVARQERCNFAKIVAL
jgi:hypothetical protein